MTTGKNKEQFEKWLDGYSENTQSALTEERDIYMDEIFNQCPFEMQIGLYLAYYDSLGYYIDVQTEFQYTREEWEDGTNPHYTPEDWYFDIHNSYKNMGCDGGFNTRNKAYKEAFKKANKIINNQ